MFNILGWLLAGNLCTLSSGVLVIAGGMNAVIDRNTWALWESDYRC